MPRPLRFETPGALWHVITRGNEQKDIFRFDDDRKKFLDLLGEASDRSRWFVQSFGLMDNHYHTTVETPETTLAQGMQWFNGQYARDFNDRHDRNGHLFGDRYRAYRVDSESYFFELVRYVVLNPVRASIVNHAGEWPWSSYRATAGEEEAPCWLRADRLLARLSNDAEKARAIYRNLISEPGAVQRSWEEVSGQMWLRGKAAFLPARRAEKQTVPRQLLLRRVVLEMLGALETEGWLSRGDLAMGRCIGARIGRDAGMPLREIGAAIGFSESRTSRLAMEYCDLAESDARVAGLRNEFLQRLMSHLAEACKGV
ncbi:MAG TPA: transposase [Thermoanaerobaculia bacterium]|nr:transposase [Thermoanaerobaculia bacterium]